MADDSKLLDIFFGEYIKTLIPVLWFTLGDAEEFPNANSVSRPKSVDSALITLPGTIVAEMVQANASAQHFESVMLRDGREQVTLFFSDVVVIRVEPLGDSHSNQLPAVRVKISFKSYEIVAGPVHAFVGPLKRDGTH